MTGAQTRLEEADTRRRVPPSASIAPFIEALYVYEPDGETPHIGIPRPEIDLVVRFGPAAKGGIDAHAFGARERVHRKLPRGVHRTLTARIRLGATETALGVPASQIAGRIIGLEQLWGEAASRELLARLAGARDVREALTLLERSIAERIASTHASRVTSPLVLDAANKLARANELGDATVTHVAGELGVSERHLRRVFRETVGLAPKAFAKVARFRRALRAAREDSNAGWAGIAIAAGYYDQAHLISEFRAIAGTTPSALLRELATASSMG